MNSTGIATAGGFGRALAEWICSGMFVHVCMHIGSTAFKTTQRSEGTAEGLLNTVLMQLVYQQGLCYGLNLCDAKNYNK